MCNDNDNGKTTLDGSDGIPVLKHGVRFDIASRDDKKKIVVLGLAKETLPVSRGGLLGYEWKTGAEARGFQDPYLWYMFRNILGDKPAETDQIYVVPSKWVDEYLREHFGETYFLPLEAAQYLEEWEKVMGNVVHNSAAAQRLRITSQPEHPEDFDQLRAIKYMLQ